MIQQSYYCYLKKDVSRVWALGFWEGDHNHSRPHHAQSLFIPHDRIRMKLRLIDTYGKSISELITEKIGVDPNLTDADLRRHFFSSNSDCKLDSIAFSTNDADTMLKIIYKAAEDAPQSQSNPAARGVMCLFIEEDISLMVEVDYRDGSPVSRHLIQFKKERQPRDAVLQRNARKLPEWVYTFVDDEYLGARKVRRIEIRSDNFGQRVDEGYAYAHITEY